MATLHSCKEISGRYAYANKQEQNERFRMIQERLKVFMKIITLKDRVHNFALEDSMVITNLGDIFVTEVDSVPFFYLSSTPSYHLNSHL